MSDTEETVDLNMENFDDDKEAINEITMEEGNETLVKPKEEPKAKPKSKLRVKKERTPAQIEAFQRAQAKRRENIQKNKQLKEEQKIKTKKTKKRKEIIQYLDESDEDFDELLYKKMMKLKSKYRVEKKEEPVIEKLENKIKQKEPMLDTDYIKPPAIVYNTPVKEHSTYKKETMDDFLNQFF
jgi:anion-transporting  ArsA/GET3 family ATPase